MKSPLPLAPPKPHAAEGGFTVRLAGFVVTVVLWRTVEAARLSPLASLVFIVGAIVLVFPTVWLGRRMIDRNPTVGHLAWITSVVHFLLMTLFGTSVVEAVKVLSSTRGVTIPLPSGIGAACLAVSGTCLVLTVVNLAVGGLGAPFAIALSRRLTRRWMYRWTRNPMVLCTLATLLSAGLYLRSLLFVLWTLFLVGPAWIFFLKMYEERELEIRFGEEYLDYRATTAFLWPRAPDRSSTPVQAWSRNSHTDRDRQWQSTAVELDRNLPQGEPKAHHEPGQSEVSDRVEWCGRGDSELDKGPRIKNLPENRIAEPAQTAQMPGSRYKTGTQNRAAISGWSGTSRRNRLLDELGERGRADHARGVDRRPVK